ncbi:ATP-binding protein [Lichenicoccus sp.]|uniref:hybrid sensor histidine kinase/response regulator n=1 Tax=Lichenicoccus sp. TaxID=2781899 RepID=UPI003D0AED32
MDHDIEALRGRLREAEETLEAIRNGDVDAVVVGGPHGQQVYTLENADRPYRVLVEQMQEGAITLGADGLILYCNERFSAMVAVPRAELIGALIGRFFAGDDADRFQALLAAGPRPQAAAEFMLSVGAGRVLPVNISLSDLVVEAGAARVTCGVVTDLSMIRRRADELAAEIEQRRRAQGSLQLALDAAGMGSWDLDLRRNTAVRSLRHDQLFGHPTMVADWTLDTALAHFIEEDRALVAEAFAAGQRTGLLEFEARIQRADDGATRWLRVTGQTFYERGVPVRIAGVVADVTDRRAVEERLRHAQKIEAVGLLTGGVAHDFNNLLTVISGGLEMIDRQRDPARRARILSGMHQAVERGSGLSRQLLAFSRRQPLRPEPIDLRHRLRGMQELLDRSLRGDVFVRTELDNDLWPVLVDPSELELVILNLAVNARDAMPDGGTIVIAGSNVPALNDAGLRGDFVRLSVIDTGTGMPPDVVARVFEPFFTTKDIGKGSGLGLAQTHGFAQASGGAVRVDSAPGAGTTIALLLPRTTELPAAWAPHSPAPLADTAPGSAGQVLLVEDDEEVAALSIEMIEQLGFGVTRVAGANAALGALADERAIDLVFSDVMMPGTMNGLALAREIGRRRPDLPVLLTSGYAEAARRDAQGLTVLAKPFRLEALAAAFAKALGSAGGHRGPGAAPKTTTEQQEQHDDDEDDRQQAEAVEAGPARAAIPAGAIAVAAAAECQDDQDDEQNGQHRKAPTN